MDDTVVFAVLVGAVALGVLLAVLSNRVSERIWIPAPALFLIGAAAFAAAFPALGALSIQSVQRLATVALIVILFPAGMDIGWRPSRSAAGPIVWLGVAGT